MRASPFTEAPTAPPTSNSEGVTFDAARSLGRQAKQAHLEQQTRQGSTDLLRSVTLPKGGAIRGIGNNVSANVAT
jgi:hypothetical protein